MPKDTFLNLPSDKQNHLIETAVDEFYLNGFNGFSITSYVKKAGIAKGSFYQYFEGKNDLFRMIMDKQSQKKIMLFNEMLQNFKEESFYVILKILYRVSLRFYKEQPKLASIGESFEKNADLNLKEEIFGEHVNQSNSFLHSLVFKGIQSGEIRSDIDIEFAVHLVTNVSLAMGDFVKQKSISPTQVDEEIYNEYVEKTISFIRNGIGV